MSTDPNRPRDDEPGASFATRVRRWLPTRGERSTYPVERQGSWLVVSPTGGEEVPAGPMRIISPGADALG